MDGLNGLTRDLSRFCSRLSSTFCCCSSIFLVRSLRSLVSAFFLSLMLRTRSDVSASNSAGVRRTFFVGDAVAAPAACLRFTALVDCGRLVGSHVALTFEDDSRRSCLKSILDFL